MVAIEGRARLYSGGALLSPYRYYSWGQCIEIGVEGFANYRRNGPTIYKASEHTRL